jgi:hypothetical protein
MFNPRRHTRGFQRFKYRLYQFCGMSKLSQLQRPGKMHAERGGDPNQ